AARTYAGHALSRRRHGPLRRQVGRPLHLAQSHRQRSALKQKGRPEGRPKLSDRSERDVVVHAAGLECRGVGRRPASTATAATVTTVAAATIAAATATAEAAAIATAATLTTAIQQRQVRVEPL